MVLGPGARLGGRCRLVLGPGARVEIDGTLEERCRISAEQLVVVETDAHLGAECVLIDADPVFADPEIPVRLQGTRSAPVRVGAGAVLGPRSAVLRGGVVAPGERLLALAVRRVGETAAPAGRSVPDVPSPT